MKTLLQLLHQYKGDVEQRLRCIENERDNDEAAMANLQETVDDYNAQIAHWEATLKGIDEVLAKQNEAVAITILALIYEWVCPDCNRRNEGSGVDEKVVCTGCNKPFKINFGG